MFVGLSVGHKITFLLILYKTPPFFYFSKPCILCIGQFDAQQTH